MTLNNIETNKMFFVIIIVSVSTTLYFNTKFLSVLFSLQIVFYYVYKNNLMSTPLGQPGHGESL